MYYIINIKDNLILMSLVLLNPVTLFIIVFFGCTALCIFSCACYYRK